MRPWHEFDLSSKEMGESVDDGMREDGFDPDNISDRNSFIDRANREAIESGNSDKMIEEYSLDDNTQHPPPDGWLESKFFSPREADKEEK